MSLKNSFIVDGDSGYKNVNYVLNPGETVEFATAILSETKNIYFSGTANSNKTLTNSKILLINNGKLNAFLFNNTENSYYVRFSGEMSGTQTNVFTVDNDYNYYIGIIRPKQILSVPMTEVGTLSEILIEADGIYSAATLSSWNTAAVQKMSKYFSNKTLIQE